MDDIWIEIPENQGKVWPELKKVLVGAFMNDPWFVWLQPDEIERKKFIDNDIQARYDSRLSNGKGMFAVLRSNPGSKKNIIGGICLSFEVPLLKTAKKVEDMTQMERSRYWLQQCVFGPMKKLGEKLNTMVWYGMLQGIQVELQHKNIGRKYLIKAFHQLIDKKRQLMQESGVTGNRTPVVFGVSIHDYTARFSERTGGVLVGYLPEYIEGFGNRHNYVFFIDLGDWKPIEEARKMFNMTSNL